MGLEGPTCKMSEKSGGWKAAHPPVAAEAGRPRAGRQGRRRPPPGEGQQGAGRVRGAQPSLPVLTPKSPICPGGLPKPGPKTLDHRGGGREVGKICLKKENICADHFNLFFIQLLKYSCFSEAVISCDNRTPS